MSSMKMATQNLISCMRGSEGGKKVEENDKFCLQNSFSSCLAYLMYFLVCFACVQHHSPIHSAIYSMEICVGSKKHSFFFFFTLEISSLFIHFILCFIFIIMGKLPSLSLTLSLGVSFFVCLLIV